MKPSVSLKTMLLIWVLFIITLINTLPANANPKEDEFQNLLRQAKTTVDEERLLRILPTFGANAVIPTLKQYEDPNSSDKQKEVAGMIILNFPLTNPVMDKIVEAYKHGRYFKISSTNNAISFEDGLAMALSWWGNMLKARLKGEKEFVKYVGEKYLFSSTGQDNLIELMADADLPTASTYFAKLNVNRLNKDALKSLLMCVYTPSYEKDKKKDEEPVRFALFCSVFKNLQPKKRETEKMVFVMDKFTLEHQRQFIISNIAIMTTKERDVAIYICSKLPANLRSKIYKKIEVSCSKMQKNMMQYYMKKASE